MWKDYRWWTVFVIIAAVALAVLVPYIIVYIFIGPVFYYFFLMKKVRARFMKDFARINGFGYREQLPVSSVRGNIFSFGHSKKIIHAVIGRYKNKNIRLFKYQARTGYGRNQQTHPFTVFEVFFEKVEFPSIILQPKRRWWEGFRVNLRKGTKEIKLEEEFKKRLSLFCAEGYEIETLQVFTPQNLRFLKEKKTRFSIEAAGDRLYIYERGFVSTQEKLSELYEVAQLIIDSLGPLFKRLSNDFEALHRYYKR